MSESQPTQEDTPAARAEPLDAFEQQWVDALRRPEPEIASSEDAFVHGVLERYAESPAAPPVLARIGWGPLAAAAAVVLAGAVAWAVLFSGGGVTDTSPMVDEQPGQSPAPEVESGLAVDTPEFVDEPQANPTPRTEAERRALAQSLQLGSLIADTSMAIRQPAAALPKTLSDTSDQLTLKSLTQGLANPVPDPAEVLPPRRDRPRG